MLSLEQVQHIAKLARLGLKGGEAEKFSKQLSSILDYIAVLEEVKTDDVEITSQVTGLENVTRPDAVERFCTKDELLGCTEQPVERGQIKVKSVIVN